jgi:hypothetical protein
MSPTSTAPFAENSHSIAFDPPIRRHLPTTLEFPQPVIANTRAIAIIRNRGFDSEKLNGMICRFIISCDQHVELIGFGPG